MCTARRKARDRLSSVRFPVEFFSPLEKFSFSSSKAVSSASRSCLPVPVFLPAVPESLPVAPWQFPSQPDPSSPAPPAFSLWRLPGGWPPRFRPFTGSGQIAFSSSSHVFRLILSTRSRKPVITLIMSSFYLLIFSCAASSSFVCILCRLQRISKRLLCLTCFRPALSTSPGFKVKFWMAAFRASQATSIPSCVPPCASRAEAAASAARNSSCPSGRYWSSSAQRASPYATAEERAVASRTSTVIVF